MKLSKDRKDLAATMLNALWRIVAGPITLVCIPLFLTPIEQGYWYTFGSIAALSVFADLGFSTIILQFAAHEFAHLHFVEQRRLAGDAEHLWKLASFFRFSVRWLRRIVLIAFPLILVVGYYFLASKGDDLDWQGAWILYAIASGVVFFNASMLCFFEGCNSVSLLQSIRFKIAVASTCTTLAGLSLGWNIYATSCSVLVNAILGTCFILYYFRETIRQLWQVSSRECYDWWPEFSSLIWRYAVSWCSGYFIFQLFTPLAFHFHGAEFSGKIGISIAMWTAGFSIANAWIVAITPRLNMLVSERRWGELDALFGKNLRRSMLTFLAGGLAYFFIYYLLEARFSFFHRVLDPFVMGMLFFSWVWQLWINSVAYYLRAHKKEPLMQMSFFSGIYIAVTTYLCARFLPSEYIFLGFLSSYFYGVPLTYRIWQRQKREHRLMPPIA